MINSISRFSPRMGIMAPPPGSLDGMTRNIATRAINGNKLSAASADDLTMIRQAFTQSTRPPAVFNVTPAGLMGAKYEACAVGNQVFVRVTPVVPNAKGSWFQAGSLPVF